MLNGYYYDDEIGNVRVAVSKSYGQIYAYFNVYDVHPAGSYLINKALFSFLKSWRAVKITGGVLQGLADGALLLAVAPRIGGKAALILALMLATCSTQVMWGASVRWYAYFIPLFVFAAAAVLAEHRRWGWELALLAVSSVLLFYINYEAAVTAPALWLLFLIKRLASQPRRSALIRLAWTSGAALAVMAALAPQILVMFSHSLKNAGDQFSSVPASVAGVAYTVTIGNAVFPLSWPAVVGLIALIVSLAWSGRALMKERPYQEVALIVAVAGAGIAFSGLGGKFRNAAPLLPIASIVWAGALARTPGYFGKAALIGMSLMQLMGVRNVISHGDTAKGSFNKPYGEVLRRLAASRPNCLRQSVLANDVVMTYLVERAGYPVSSPFEDRQPAGPIGLAPGDCFYVILSDAGGLSSAEASRYTAFSPPATLQLQARSEIGPDPLSRFKGKLGGAGASYFFDFRFYRATAATEIQRWTPG